MIKSYNGQNTALLPYSSIHRAIVPLSSIEVPGFKIQSEKLCGIYRLRMFPKFIRVSKVFVTLILYKFVKMRERKYPQFPARQDRKFNARMQSFLTIGTGDNHPLKVLAHYHVFFVIIGEQ